MGKRRMATAVVMAAALAGMGGALLARPAPLPTMEDINKLVDGGQWKDGLAAISRVLVLTGPAAAPYDRPKLMMLKAECQLQQHDNVGATATLALAKKDAKDWKEAAEPTALAELMKKSVQGAYTSKEPGSVPISLLDRTKRKDAYTALATDDLAALQTQVKNGAAITTLQPLIQLGQATAPARAAEYSGTGKTDKSDALTAQLAAQAQKLMANALTQLSQRVEAVSLSANKQVVVNQAVNFGRGQVAPVQAMRPQGLSSGDITTLKDVQKQCDQFGPAARDLTLAFGDEKGFMSVQSQATQLKSRADAVLNANYDWNGVGGPISPR